MRMVNIDGVEIPFESEWDICISVSGGADSALLAYLLCSMCNSEQTIHIINHKRMWKSRPWQEYDAINVYEYLLAKFPDLTFVYHKNFIAPELEYGNMGPALTDCYGKKVSGDNIQQRSFAEFICTKHNIDVYYNAVTRNPPIQLEGAMYQRDIVKSDDNKHLELMNHMNFIASHPFRFTDKSWVIKQYIKRDIQDLLDITRSCEGEFSEIDYTNYKPGQYVPLCNNCFWCLEREWAINAK